MMKSRGDGTAPGSASSTTMTTRQPPTGREPRLLDQVRHAIRTRHYSKRTEEAYVKWIVRYIKFHGTRHPRDLGEDEIRQFITHLAVEHEVAASTQN